MTRRGGRRQVRSGSAGLLGNLASSVRALAFSMFGADSYNVDGGTGKVASWREQSLHPSGILSIAPSHVMAQATSALQCAVPTPNSLFLGRVSATFVDQRYSSSAAASAWSFLHDGTGNTVYDVFEVDTVAAGQRVRLSTSYGSTQRGWNVACSAGTLVGFLASGAATISVIQSASILSTGTAYYARSRYAEGASPEHDVHLKTTLGASGATTAAPSSSDPVGTLMLGNRVITLDQPFVGKWLESVILKGAYSASADTLIKAYFTTKYGVT